MQPSYLWTGREILYICNFNKAKTRTPPANPPEAPRPLIKHVKTQGEQESAKSQRLESSFMKAKNITVQSRMPRQGSNEPQESRFNHPPPAHPPY